MLNYFKEQVHLPANAIWLIEKCFILRKKKLIFRNVKTLLKPTDKLMEYY